MGAFKGSCLRIERFKLYGVRVSGLRAYKALKERAEGWGLEIPEQVSKHRLGGVGISCTMLGRTVSASKHVPGLLFKNLCESKQATRSKPAVEEIPSRSSTRRPSG